MVHDYAMCASTSALHAAGEPFKTCTSCRAIWPTRDDFLTDPLISLVGYQPHFEELTAGLMLFTHTACGTTLALEVAAFQTLKTSPVFTRRLTNTAACPGLCLHASALRPCPLACECAWVRDVLARIQAWPKRQPGGAVAAP